MRTNSVKEKLRAGLPTFGTWLSLGDLFATRVLARLGWDWLTLDMEHSPLDWERAAGVFAAVADAGGIPLCRVPEGTHFYIKRALDAGAWGIVVPMVNTVAQAKAAIAAAKYPPAGNRSVGGGMHCLNFAATAGEYYERANDEILVVLQTESPEGVRNAREIYALPGCDAIFVGPNDLRAQMRPDLGREPTDAEFEALLQEVIDIGKATNTPTGMHVMSAAAAQQRTAQGMRFLAVASDLRMMTEKAQETLKVLRPEQAQRDVARY